MVKVPKFIKIAETNIMLIYEDIHKKNTFLGIGSTLFIICHKTLVGFHFNDGKYCKNKNSFGLNFLS